MPRELESSTRSVRASTVADGIIPNSTARPFVNLSRQGYEGGTAAYQNIHDLLMVSASTWTVHHNRPPRAHHRLARLTDFFFFSYSPPPPPLLDALPISFREHWARHKGRKPDSTRHVWRVATGPAIDPITNRLFYNMEPDTAASTKISLRPQYITDTYLPSGYAINMLSEGITHTVAARVCDTVVGH